jgi:FtsP/CotA-like multicopper oxidase with cupredoxin domain
MKFPQLLFSIAILAAPTCSFASASDICPRFDTGSVLTQPEQLYSSHGSLSVNFTYRTRLDSSGNTLYCFVSDHNIQSPTLHVRPGDELVIHLKNELPSGSPMTMQAMPGMALSGRSSDSCGAMTMTSTSVNIHYHGANVPPVCHQDEVIQTTINAGESFTYDVHFPKDEPPGLYWYHPHIHGIAEAAVLGGASGAIIVDGIENVNPSVAGLRQQVLIVRDNLVPGNPTPGGTVPSWDVSVNYVPVPFPSFTPATIGMHPEERQFWRVLNASADTILDLQVDYDGAIQTLEVIGLDGVPTGSQDGTSRGKSVFSKHILLAPAARAEFVVTAPSAAVQSARLVTRNIQTGPDGDNDPDRPLIAIKTEPKGSREEIAAGATMPEVSAPPPIGRFAGLAKSKPTTQRKLYFSEVLSDPNDPNSPTNFFITVDGQTPTLFDPSNPPAIVTTQGAVEDWTIENRALENHEFHIHQIHFLQLEQNGVKVPGGQFLDTIQIPFWSGTGPYPSVKVRMDFRGSTIGDFVYHCHILGHEDGGMMAVIRVNPAPNAEGR